MKEGEKNKNPRTAVKYDSPTEREAGAREAIL